MASWGPASFENDDAAAWAVRLVRGGTAEWVLETLGAVADLPDEDFLDEDQGAAAIAAAEVVAAAGGRPAETEDAGEDALAWAMGHAELGTPACVALAIRAVVRVLDTESELRERWAQDPHGGDWIAATDDLQYRLALTASQV